MDMHRYCVWKAYKNGVSCLPALRRIFTKEFWNYLKFLRICRYCVGTISNQNVSHCACRMTVNVSRRLADLQLEFAEAPLIYIFDVYLDKRGVNK